MDAVSSIKTRIFYHFHFACHCRSLFIRMQNDVKIYSIFSMERTIVLSLTQSFPIPQSYSPPVLSSLVRQPDNRVPHRQVPDHFGMGGMSRKMKVHLEVLFVLVGNSGEKQAGLTDRPLFPNKDVFGKGPFCFVGDEWIDVLHPFFQGFPVRSRKFPEIVGWCG